MPEPPFNIISCTWPRPIEQADRCWVSDPEWLGPLMPVHPQPSWEKIDGELCWTIDWRKHFRGGLKPYEPQLGGEMRGFHIIFTLQINGSGKLLFWDDDGCIIRRCGEVVHCDRSAHPPRCSSLDVTAGDYLEIAQWQLDNDWLWGARLIPEENTHVGAVDLLLPYLGLVCQRLRRPEGPPLKLYTDARVPVRMVVGVYSLILNGYAPHKILLYGDNQWDHQKRELFAMLMPFAEVVPTEHVFSRIHSFGGKELEAMARKFWWVMKTLIALLCPPGEFCLMDDDIFVLDNLNDGLKAFQQYDLVFAPDTDHGSEYLAHWGWMNQQAKSLRTGRFNAGLYWMRNTHDPYKVASEALRLRPEGLSSFIWEQGFIASLYALKNIMPLPSQRYFFALFDGLPGGKLGYDYRLNPCGFSMVHFGGLFNKPTDAETLFLAREILERRHSLTEWTEITCHTNAQ